MTPTTPFARAIAVAALLGGVLSAAGRAWLCDDAFISFRYAGNLVRGNGLVYNAGERVEGYTNFLWTIWCAIPFRLGLDVEWFAVASGLFLFALLLWRILSLHRRLAGPGELPIALLGAAVAPDLANFATSGLETCLVALLVLWGYDALLSRRRALAGLAFGLATLSRPDAGLFVVCATAWVLFEDLRIRVPAAGERVRFSPVFSRFEGAATLAVSAAVLVVPHLAFRLSYYGALVPNTYFAKSAELSWWSQGLTYVLLFFARYWPLALGALVALTLLARGEPAATSGEGAPASGRAMALGLVLAVPYTGLVARVGGDFMFARLLVPVMPLLLFVLERAVAVVLERARQEHGLLRRAPATLRAYAGPAAAMLVVVAIGLTPSPVGDRIGPHGIVDERLYYAKAEPEWTEYSVRNGKTLQRYFSDLPVRIAFFGGEARLVFYADPALAIESAAGLTDAFVARQELKKRGRVGHEKAAPATYLLARRVHFFFTPVDGRLPDLERRIPLLRIDLDGVLGRIVTWDPRVMEELRLRGARFPDLPRLLDEDIRLGRGRDEPESIRTDRLARLEAFYFRPAADPVRRNRYREMLRLPP